jgi:hypothetical protein
MSIDGIGKPGSPKLPGADEVGARSSATGGERFEVGKPASLEAASGSDALQALGRGDISLDEYLDTRVAEAVAHLAGQLSPEQLEFVQQTLREQLRTDPVLIELVRRTTGSVPTDLE